MHVLVVYAVYEMHKATSLDLAWMSQVGWEHQFVNQVTVKDAIKMSCDTCGKMHVVSEPAGSNQGCFP